MSYQDAMLVTLMVTIILVLAIMPAIMIYMLRRMRNMENKIQQLNYRMSCSEDNALEAGANAIMLYDKIDKLEKRVDVNADGIVQDRLAVNERNMEGDCQSGSICLSSVIDIDCCVRSGSQTKS
ncbi:hypothetical protein [Ehrlichia muris]|uniref:Uncharacterized protein n=1 Tax=Ehrlichia muris AS145 TaxID=1423892 RepID=V9RAC7_9RICK|nr:hypothetical protein [Ehrlichia muris]AHC39739.1 hypothetical protein EMUR_03765 [Ehrlichia muris AS145]